MFTPDRIVETAGPPKWGSLRVSWYVIGGGALRKLLALTSHQGAGIEKREGPKDTLLMEPLAVSPEERPAAIKTMDTSTSLLRQLCPHVHSLIDTTMQGGPPLPGMNLLVADGETDARMWCRFVEEHRDATFYHRWGWKQVVGESFGWPTFFLMAKDGEAVQGIFPIVWQKSRMFGSFLTSLPFVNGGGVLAKTPAARDALLAEGIASADFQDLSPRGFHHHSPTPEF